ncbi:MAG: Hsp20/alpha crystallin family protein [Bryobacteraceae bacterium]
MKDKPRQLPAFLFPAFQTQEITHWRPSLDIYRMRNGWLLKFDLAGVPMEDVNVEVQGGRITVSGVRRDYVAEEADACYAMEIAYNRFERTVELPCEFANPAVTLEGRDGILIIRVTEG